MPDTDIKSKPELKPKKEKAQPEKKVVAPIIVPKHARKVSFEVWATRRAIPQHHKRGMRAFINDNKERSLDKWDALFESY